MTEFENPDEPDFEDPSYAEISALLAEAAATGPMPPDVASSLDDVLAGLVAERASGTSDTVVPLRRRALNARRLLVAAAAVVLVGAGGVGLNQVLRDTTTSTASDATADAAPQVPAAVGATPESTSDLAGSTEDSRGNLDQAYAARNQWAGIRFTRADFAQQVTSLAKDRDLRGPFLDSDVPAPSDAPPASGTPGTATEGSKGLGGTAIVPQCPGPPATGDVIVVPITFEGAPAALAVHPLIDGSRYVAAWSCDGHQLLAYATVPG